jgi:hypothetical protein
LEARGGDDLISRGLEELLERDAEADGVINVQVETMAWSVGLYSCRCVTLRGDVVRGIRAVMLPMPSMHMGTHGQP